MANSCYILPPWNTLLTENTKPIKSRFLKSIRVLSVKWTHDSPTGRNNKTMVELFLLNAIIYIIGVKQRKGGLIEYGGAVFFCRTWYNLARKMQLFRAAEQ